MSKGSIDISGLFRQSSGTIFTSKLEMVSCNPNPLKFLDGKNISNSITASLMNKIISRTFPISCGYHNDIDGKVKLIPTGIYFFY